MLDSLETTVDHVRGGPDARLILEYGDYKYPYSRRAFRAIQRVEGTLGDRVRFAFRHFPLTDRHPHERILRDMESGIALRPGPRHDPVHRRRRVPRSVRRRHPVRRADRLIAVPA